MNSSLITKLLAVILIVLAVVLFEVILVNKKSSKRIFSDQTLESLVSLKIKKDGSELTFTKTPETLKFGLAEEVTAGQWIVSAPEIYSVNRESLNKLFSTLSVLTIDHQIQAISNHSNQFGLENPFAEIEGKTNSEQVTLKLGAINPVSKRRYAQTFVNGVKQAIAMLDEGTVSGLLKLEFRDLYPLKLPPREISSFEISLEGKKTRFVKKDGVFKEEGRETEELDSHLIDEYLEALLTSKIFKTGAKIPLQKSLGELKLEWKKSESDIQQIGVQFGDLSEAGVTVKVPRSSFNLEFGPEFFRLLHKSTESLINQKPLRDIVLGDFLASCPNVNFKASCQLNFDLKPFEDAIRRVEVIHIERLPGRLMSAKKSECRLKSDSADGGFSFEIGAPVEEVDAKKETSNPPVDNSSSQAAASPRIYVTDIGKRHYQGVISSQVADGFCSIVRELCNEAVKSCGV